MKLASASARGTLQRLEFLRLRDRHFHVGCPGGQMRRGAQSLPCRGGGRPVASSRGCTSRVAHVLATLSACCPGRRVLRSMRTTAASLGRRGSPTPTDGRGRHPGCQVPAAHPALPVPPSAPGARALYALVRVEPARARPAHPRRLRLNLSRQLRHLARDLQRRGDPAVGRGTPRGSEGHPRRETSGA